MIKAIIFDKDGTLMEISNIWTVGMFKYIKDLNPGKEIYKELQKIVGIDDEGKIDPQGMIANKTIKEVGFFIYSFFK